MGESNQDFLFIEKFEEIRSRISILSSFYDTIEQNFRGIKRYALLMPYPLRSLENIKTEINNLIKEVEKPLDLSHYKNAVKRLSFLDYESRKIQDYLLELQTLMEQRITGATIHKFLDFNPNFQLEHCNMEKVYYALDSVGYDFLQRMFSTDKWTINNGVPLSSFGRQGYHIIPLTYQIVIPYHDIFRLRFWPILAHEVAHLWVQEYISKPIDKIRHKVYKMTGDDSFHGIIKGIGEFDIKVDELPDFFLQSIIEYSELLLKHEYANLVSQDRVTDQFIEMTSDIIATYVCGPSYPFAISSLFSLTPGDLLRTGRKPPFEILEYLTSSHPLSEARISSSYEILKLQGIHKFDEVFEAHIDLNQKKKKLFDPHSIQFMDEYIIFYNKYSENLHEIFSEIDYLNGFDAEDFDKIIHISDDLSCFSQLAPIHLLNLAWIKRINKFKDDYKNDLASYYEMKKRESKTYELIIDQMYNYYTSNIFNRRKQ